MDSVLLKAFYNVKNGQIDGLGAKDITAINAFLNWKIYIIPGEVGIINEINEKIAYLKANTTSLKSTHKYVICVNQGEPSLYIESGVNIPVFLGLNRKSVLPIKNTPNPTKIFNNYYVNYEHKVIPVEVV